MTNTPGRNAPKQNKLSPVVLACVVLACVMGVALILLLPAESLAVDLVYQGF